MELRPLTLGDKDAQNRLMSEAFSGGSRPDDNDNEEKEPDTKPTSPVLGMFDGTRLVASLTTHALHISWGTEVVPLGGIAGVACTADQRGRGHVGKLLQESLKTMRDAGQFLSGLFPFSVAFYRRYGWDWVGEERIYTIPTAEIKAYPEGKHLRCYEGMEGLEVVRPVYDTFARRYRGMLTRTDPTPAFWDWALKNHGNRTTYVQVYHAPETGMAEGYLTFRYPKKGNTADVGELIATTPAAYRGLLSVLHYYGTQVQKVRFSAPADSPLPLYVMHNDLKALQEPSFMARVVDVSAAFTTLRSDPGLSGQVTIAVTDEYADWNQKTFQITIEAGQVSVTTTQAVAGIALDIQTLTQAYWGHPSLGSLRTAGRLSVTDEKQYETLAKLLPPAVCYLQDDF